MFDFDTVKDQLTVIRIRTDDKQVHQACMRIESMMIAELDRLEREERIYCTDRLNSNQIRQGKEVTPISRHGVM